MFQKIKKTKLQEIENQKMNENVEKNEDISVRPESIFPKAETLLQDAQNKWKQITSEEILKEIKAQALKGHRYAKFYNSLISDELAEELKAQGYTLNVVASPAFVGPYFEISW